jgi:hypothetical protein
MADASSSNDPHSQGEYNAVVEKAVGVKVEEMQQLVSSGKKAQDNRMQDRAAKKDAMQLLVSSGKKAQDNRMKAREEKKKSEEEDKARNEEP